MRLTYSALPQIEDISSRPVFPNKDEPAVQLSVAHSRHCSLRLLNFRKLYDPTPPAPAGPLCENVSTVHLSTLRKMVLEALPLSSPREISNKDALPKCLWIHRLAICAVLCERETDHA